MSGAAEVNKFSRIVPELIKRLFLTATKISIAFGVAPAWVMGFDVAPFDKVSEVAAKLGRLSPDNLQLVENLIDTLLS